MTRLVWLRGAEELFYVAFLGLCAEYGCEHSPHCEVARRHNGGRENEPLPRQARLSTGLPLRQMSPLGDAPWVLLGLSGPGSLPSVSASALGLERPGLRSSSTVALASRSGSG